MTAAERESFVRLAQAEQARRNLSSMLCGIAFNEASLTWVHGQRIQDIDVIMASQRAMVEIARDVSFSQLRAREVCHA
jgi:hypothetical protein